MSEREELEKAMMALDQQRTMLGDAAVEAALAGLQQKLSALDSGASTSSEQLLARLMPQALAVKMRAARQVEGERKQVTVLFADLSGYTPLSERLDPEVVMNLSQDLLKELAEAVYQHEGYVAQFMGDAVMAVFGAPLTHEDDPKRAVHAAFDMHERAANLSHRWLDRVGQSLALHIGINTGIAVTGSVGSDLRMDYAVIGDTTNTAQRIQSTAQRGEILISRETYLLTREAFACEALEPLVVKGKREPVLVYRVLGVRAKPGSGRGLEEHGLVAPLVGRENEFQAITSCMERLSSTGEGGIIGIIGEAGLGKSRLVAESKTFVVANNPNVLWLEGQTLSFGQTISYWPFQQILRSWAGVTEEDDTDASWSKLENHVHALFAEEAIDYLPYLASLLAIPVQGEYAERVKYLDGDAMGKQIFLTSRRFFERLARTQPAVLVFEDLHWMDESSTLLLEHLLPLVETVPLVIFGNSRPERETPAAHLRELCGRDFANHYTEILLAPLSQLDSAQLIDNLLDIENLPARLRDLIVDKADGNPFFLEEVIRTLIDTRAVTRDVSSGRWHATAQIETFHIPDTIQGVIMARVDRLDEEVKGVLRIASVIGRSFLYRVLRAMIAVGQRLDDDLLELQHSELIREKQQLPELEYMFQHALAQEATYESILLQKRRELHARVAQAIEQLFVERQEEFYGMLAYHYARAEVWDKAQDYLLKAADQAGRMAADTEAITHYQQAIAAYGRAFGNKWDPGQRALLERKIGEAFVRRSEYQTAIEHFRQGLDYLGYHLPMTHWQVRWALMRQISTQVTHRLLPGRLLKNADESPFRRVENEAFLYYDTALVDAFTNSERYLLLALRLLNLSELCGYELGIVLGADNLGVTLDFMGFFDQAEWYHRKAVGIAEELRHPFGLGGAYFGLEAHATYFGELDQALEYGRRSVEAFNTFGDIFSWGLSTSFLGWVSFHRCDFARALDYCWKMIRLGQDSGAQALWCWGEAIQGYALRRKGQLDEAVMHQQQASKLAKTIPDYIYQVITGAELGLCDLRQGDLKGALSKLNICQCIVTEQRVLEPFSLATFYNNRADAHLWAAQHTEKSERAIWMDHAKRYCQIAFKQSLKCRTKLPEAMRLQGTYGWLREKPATARKWWQKSLAEAERMGMRYDEGMAHFEMGKRLGERTHLEKAETIFSEIGAEWDLARTRELLDR